MFYNLSVMIKPEDIYTCIVFVGWPMLVTMQHYKVAFGNSSFKLHSFTGIFSSHSFKIPDKGFFTISHMRVMLYVYLSCILSYCFFKTALIEHEIVKCYGV